MRKSGISFLKSLHPDYLHTIICKKIAMSNLKIKVSIFINYFLFAILLNSVGTVILQVQHYFKVNESSASVLEAFKDLTIAATSFIVASFISRIGYKKSMLIALGMVTAACFVIPSVGTFIGIKLLFAVTGASFALIKVSVYGIIGLVTKNEKEHLSMMNFIESFFMAGILSGYFIFGYFIEDTNNTSAAWFNVYYLLGALSLTAFLLLLGSPLDESAAHKSAQSSAGSDVIGMLRLMIMPLVISFVCCAFFYVLIEQSIMSWLPTFNNKVLKLSSTMSVQMASILSVSIGLGRFSAAIVLKKINWFLVLVFCLAAAACLVLIALPIAKSVTGIEVTTWTQVPIAAFVFPLIGFFLAPVYPAINSEILSSLPKNKHGTMSGLIVFFSAIGGTLGSITTGFIFQMYGGQTAFYFSLIPISILIIGLIVFRKTQNKTHLVS